MTTGANAPGIAMLARIAVARSPPGTTICPETISSDRAVGIGSGRSWFKPRARNERLPQSSMLLLVLTMPPGTTYAVGPQPIRGCCCRSRRSRVLRDRLEVPSTLSAADDLPPVDARPKRSEFGGRHTQHSRATIAPHAGARVCSQSIVHCIFRQHLEHADMARPWHRRRRARAPTRRSLWPFAATEFSVRADCDTDIPRVAITQPRSAIRLDPAHKVIAHPPLPCRRSISQPAQKFSLVHRLARLRATRILRKAAPRPRRPMPTVAAG